MRITYKGDYALKILLDLSLNYGKGWIPLKKISQRQDIPIKYLEQLALILKGAGFIKTKRGAAGGIVLAKAPQKIRIGEIVRLMDGTTAPITCVSKTARTKCRDEKTCPFVPLWLDIRNYINALVDNTTFFEMAEKQREMNQSSSLSYSI